MIRRREFISGIGAAAVVGPNAVKAQLAERLRRVGVLMGGAPADTPESKASIAAFFEEFQQLGWTQDHNVRIDVRWAAGNPDHLRRYAKELVALGPDVILTNGTGTMAPMLQAKGGLPLVFVNVSDPVGGGFVESLARPGGNVTGFANFEYGIAGKWLELLKEISPGLTRAGVIREPANPAGIGQWAIIQAAAPTIGVDVSPINFRESAELEKAFGALPRANAGLIVTTSAAATVHRKLIISLASRHKLPVVYSRKLFVRDGGLMSYGTDLTGQYRQAAKYVDRILKGENPADLPVEQSRKFELVINLNTAKTLGLTVPPTLLARADEVIE